MKKRILSLMLVLAMMFGMVPVFGVATSAAISAAATLEDAVTTGATEDYAIYLAWYHTFYNSNGRDFWLKRWSDTNAFNTFAKLYDREDVGSFLITKFAQMGYNDEVQFYESLLFSLLGTGQSTSSGISFNVFESDVYNATNIIIGLASEIDGTAIADATVALGKLVELGPDFFQKVGDACKKMNKISPVADYIGKSLAAFQLAINAAENTEEAKARVQNIINTCQVADGYKRLFEVLSTDENDVMREVATTVYQYMSTDDFDVKVQDLMKSVQKSENLNDAEDVASAVFSLISGPLGLACDAADLLFNLKDNGESSYVMWMLRDMNNSIARAAGILKEDFRGNPTSEPAANYIMTMDLWHRFLFKACSYTKDHIDDIYDSCLRGGIVSQNNYTTYLNQVEEEKDLVLEAYSTFYSAPAELFEEYLGILNSKHKISYNANGGTGAPASHENTVGTTALSTTVPIRTGHTFLGWDENPNAKEPTYRKKNDGSPITIDKEGNVKLYAIWQPKTFNIIFDANGGVFTEYDNATTVTRPKVYAQNFTFDVTYPVRDGYKCIGWSLENDNTVDWVNGETENDIGSANANDKRVYAVWAASEYVVTYDYNDGSLKEDKVKVPITNNTTYTILPAPKNPDTFKGWMLQDPNGDYWWTNGVWDNGKVSIIQPGTNLQLTGNLTLYAKWDYFVHYNDGTGYTHEAVRDGNDYVIDAPLHTPSGKEFKSWKGEDANGNVAYYKVGDTIDLTTDLTLTATWSDGSAAESYVSVSYDANGGRGSIADDEVIAGGKVTLDDGDSLYRNGYDFVGWAEEPNAVERDYRGGARITVDEDLTLYAVWKAVSDETRATVTMSADKEVYKPGDTIILTVLADHSDHFFVDAANTGFNLVRQDGSTEGTAGDFYVGVFTEKNSPSKWYPQNRYENGEEYKVKLYIPNNCSDGTYTISIKVTESILNDTGNGNVDNIDVPIAVSVQIKVDEDYEDKVTVNINKSKVTLHIDDVDTLQATITPSSAKRDLEWYSSNESVVTVTEKSNQKGRIVATGYGTATITADVNGVKDTCTVVVERCTYDQKDVSSIFLKTPATCSSYAIYYKSCECGYHGSSTFTYTEGGYADHTYSNKWSTNENSHWHAATCEHANEKKDFGSHVYDNETDASCNTCGYTRTIEHVHDWGAVTYTWAEDGSSCTAQRVCTKNSNHKETATATITSAEKIPATETVEGTTTYTATFAENWAVKQTKDIQDIPVTSHVHTWGIVTYIWAEDGSNCTAQRVCTKNSNHKETATATITSTVKTPATETVEGTTTYTATFTESWAAKQTKDIQDIPASSHVHNWGDVTYTWAEDGSSCTAQRVCTKNSNHKETAIATITSAEKIPATETVKGTTTYTATFAESWAAKQTKDIQDIPTVQIQHNTSNVWTSDSTHHWHNCSCGIAHDKQLHTESEWIVDNVATGSKNGSRHKECIICEYITATDIIPATGSNSDENFWLWYVKMLNNREFDITASVTEGGTISSAGTSKVKYGKNVTYTITPNEGYTIADVLVDGKSVGAVSEYTFKRIKEAHTISAIFEKLEWTNPFNDVSKEAWYYEDIEFAYENNLMIGTSDDAFSPNAIVNRAMLVTVLWRLEGSPVVDSSVNFVDVPAGEWYTDAVNWASANDIVNGYGDGIFGATNDLTHEQVAAILNRYAVYKKLSENVSGNANDAYTNSEWAENNVLWADINGMFDGIGSDISNLTKGATRAELAAYLRRFCEKVMK